jgi:hypothetical protein
VTPGARVCDATFVCDVPLATELSMLISSIPSWARGPTWVTPPIVGCCPLPWRQ